MPLLSIQIFSTDETNLSLNKVFLMQAIIIITMVSGESGGISRIWDQSLFPLHSISPRLTSGFKPEITRAAPSAEALLISDL